MSTKAKYDLDKQEKIQRKFFMGNEITTTDKVKAAKDLLGRDHKKLLQLLLNYRKGQLGAYFVKEYPEYIGHFLLEFLIRR